MWGWSWRWWPNISGVVFSNSSSDEMKINVFVFMCVLMVWHCGSSHIYYYMIVVWSVLRVKIKPSRSKTWPKHNKADKQRQHTALMIMALAHLCSGHPQLLLASSRNPHTVYHDLWPPQPFKLGVHSKIIHSVQDSLMKREKPTYFCIHHCLRWNSCIFLLNENTYILGIKVY